MFQACTTKCEFATVSQLFQYKSMDIKFEPFPGYTDDQWGIKAHNRPYIVNNCQLKRGQTALEVGGAYSTLPLYLAKNLGVESWIADDFGAYNQETELWSRWGDPGEWISAHKEVTYKRTPLGVFNTDLPDNYFDLVFSVSTLEHIPVKELKNVMRDMLRITKPGGRQIHLIDIQSVTPGVAFKEWFRAKIPFFYERGELSIWKSILNDAGIECRLPFPSLIETLRRDNLVESPDVVYRFYPPNNAPSEYRPSLSLILELTKSPK